MSLQHVFRLVTLHHAFWASELERAPEEEREDCRFFRQQCSDELSAIERQMNALQVQSHTVQPAADAPVAVEASLGADEMKRAERTFSTRPPAIKRLRRGQRR